MLTSKYYEGWKQKYMILVISENKKINKKIRGTYNKPSKNIWRWILVEHCLLDINNMLNGENQDNSIYKKRSYTCQYINWDCVITWDYILLENTHKY